ncbi:hypothetical protein N780_15565 [Pontibacillus chungwhensis BH030062]|uniref:Uncharacterized protein n=1 Tax=Pontibacillus chungwhensis BH030062 TaxID=1385513 RepID=A0A0A2UVN8_9BACI|nr:hypothetical protein [Pontibacillus chungwhensis]KGP91989.1 hypothetical protein N780_15565 [Pontibacillus chungwhensis BH030062]
MDPYLEKILTRQIIRSLPSKQRDVYTYVTAKEERIAEKAIDKQGFLDLLTQQSIYKKAAKKYHMTEAQLHALLKQAELTILNRLHGLDAMWIDFTDNLKESQSKKLFYFSLRDIKNK